MALTVTPFKQYNSSRMGQKPRTMGGRSLSDLGEPFWITCAMVWHSSSVVAAATIFSHVIAFNFGSLLYIDVKAAFSVVSTIWTGLSRGVPAGYREAQSGAKLSFPGAMFYLGLYISILSLKYNRWGFLIFSRSWSENSFTSGK